MSGKNLYFRLSPSITNRFLNKKLNPKYFSFLRSPSKDKWQKIGISRRSGIAVPLFSLYSKSSIGIGEIPDLKFLIDWCKQVGFSIIQLLPIYDTGYDFSPYSAVSSFALDPMYLNLNKLIGVDSSLYSIELASLKKKFPVRNKSIDYKIKKEKISFLDKVFRSIQPLKEPAQLNFENGNKYWLYDYALFKVISERNGTSGWENWQLKEKNHNHSLLHKRDKKLKQELDFHIWVQWQLFEQMSSVKTYAESKNVLLMGDIPFLVSRDSADVWSHQKYFKLNLTAGAPPDMYFAYGQKWGMPPYNWKKIKSDNYKYLKERLRYSENFFHMYRIDHFVGLFRIWTVPRNSPPELGALRGDFEPSDPQTWENHGKGIIDVMLKSTSMFPCAEDLGTVPACSFKTLKEYSVPGVEFQRFLKKNNKFVKPDRYRKNSVSVLSTHDSSFLMNWFEFEAGSIDKNLFELTCSTNGIRKSQTKLIMTVLFQAGSNNGRLFWKRRLTLKDIKHLLRYEKSLQESVKELFIESKGEEERFKRFLGLKSRYAIKSQIISRALKIINSSSSIFSIQLIHEYLSLDSSLLKKFNMRTYRINSPGTTDKKNWTLRLPLSLEKLLHMKINSKIRKINILGGRS